MVAPIHEVIDTALQLSPEDRRRLLAAIEDSLLEDAPLSPEWQAEIERRITAHDRGETQSFPLEESLARIRKMLDDRRRS